MSYVGLVRFVAGSHPRGQVIDCLSGRVKVGAEVVAAMIDDVRFGRNADCKVAIAETVIDSDLIDERHRCRIKLAAAILKLDPRRGKYYLPGKQSGAELKCFAPWLVYSENFSLHHS